MISLFSHNEAAYEAAEEMLSETGKAAIIHPTGTGKSFIGFRLCETHADASVCWLSPSSYIFETQIENLKKVTGGYVPENITFFTYAKLMLLSDEEIADIRPDYIIIDEFHRAGAAAWQVGVQKLLTAYPSAPILGLSATNIRYLDNQRDMTDELFDGNVASEMTLGEAIVRGILNPPKYVLSVFSYQKDLEKYQRRVRQAKNRAARDAAEKILDALHRALDKADGLDEIFAKHMTAPHGKYIVFCANAEHMGEMIKKVPEWFAKVDTKPHIYSAYSDDPATSQAFRDFKTDTGDHLKLLFCIDMLNEGVHVDDIDGVILLRPTISPIIYKQQIGRALSASSKSNAVIFDIVNNFENLYSISAIQEEMQAAINYYRDLGEADEIINERFRIIDEVRDCKALFDSLNDTLEASWDIMYGYAKAYFETHGNLNVPKRYKTPDGYSLGTWVTTQRKVKSGQIPGHLSDDRIEKLDAIGMIWQSISDFNWEKNIAALKEYCAEYGNADVKVDYVTESGIALGRWIANLRIWHSGKVKTNYLTPERIK
ncbi:MAG: Helicase associated domain protein, partial [Eubacteriales bacterium]